MRPRQVPRLPTSRTPRIIPAPAAAAAFAANSVAAATEGTPRNQYGVEFRDLQPNDRLILGSLVWHQMYEHPRSVA